MNTLRITFLLFLSMTFVSVSAQTALTITELMYNSPGEDLEFIEFYNNSDTALDLAGYAIVDGIDYLFPAVELAAQGTLVVTSDSVKFQRFYNQAAWQWDGGSLSNGGEGVEVADTSDQVIISFEYSDNQPWPQIADGGGASLTLCDPTADPSLPESWERSTTVAGIEEGVAVYADPGVYEGCQLGAEPVLVAGIQNLEVNESEGMTVVQFFMDNAPDTTTSFLVEINSAGGAIEGEDFTLLTDTLSYSDARSSVQNVEFELIDDMIDEAVESFTINLTPIDNAIALEAQPTVSIISCNEAAETKLKLKGVIHSSVIKAVELVVLDSISEDEMRTYGIGSANNGNGSGGQEFTLTGSALPWTCVFVTNDTIAFKEFFGPIDNMLLIQDEELEADFNGNDAIELFKNCKVVDTYGVADVDGSGEVWDYDDGWAQNNQGIWTKQPRAFDASVWQYSGPQGLDGATNEASSVPYPLECSFLIDNVAELGNFDFSIYPNPSEGIIFIDSEAQLDNLTITNNLGQIIYQAKGSEIPNRIDLEQGIGTMVFVTAIADGKAVVRKIWVH